MPTPAEPDDAAADVVILGGGLAGLSLALQLRGRLPALKVLVLERRRHPLPLAAHKVGESMVEIGAHYLAETLGLREHLESEHIRKFGFRFFFSDGREDLDALTELGVREVLPTPSYQVGRGLLENFMAGEARRRGIDFRDGVSVRGIEVDTGNGHAHRVQVRERDGHEREIRAHWLIDASGRAGLLKRKLGLARGNAHNANAAWFRLDARLTLDDWVDNPAWRAQCRPAERWRSTNHMVGPGYWVWLIPLPNGAHSVGIVADAAMHPLESMNTFERALAWLGEHQPAVARACQAQREHLLDFAFLRDYSYGCAQVFSGERWALTGEAGVFLDPFYSPGTDFIAIGNTYITELIARDTAGGNIAPYARLYEQIFFSFYENTLTLFQDQYRLFGDAEVLPFKVIWDYAYYWGVLCQLVFQDRLTDTALLGELRAELETAQMLNRRMQAMFLRWHAASGGRNPARMLDQCELDWFVELNATLHDKLDDAGTRQRLRDNVALLERLAQRIAGHARSSCPDLDGVQLEPAQPPDPEQPALFVDAA